MSCPGNRSTSGVGGRGPGAPAVIQRGRYDNQVKRCRHTRYPRCHLLGRRLRKIERLSKSGSTAATGRRAVEHPPQPGFHW